MLPDPVGIRELSQPGHEPSRFAKVPSERLALLETIWASGQAQSTAFLGATLSDTSSRDPSRCRWHPLPPAVQLCPLPWCLFPPSLIAHRLPRFVSAGGSSTSLWDQSHRLIVRLPLFLEVFFLLERAHSAPLSLLLSVCYNCWH